MNDDLAGQIRRCIVCGTHLLAQVGRGRPRKTCRDEDSPTPGGCAAWRRYERQQAKRTTHLEERAITIIADMLQAGHRVTIEYLHPYR